MNPFKKTAKIIAIILAAALLLAGLVFLLFRPLYYRFYPFDRITGTLRITVDGEEYALKAGDVTGRLDASEIAVGFRNGADGAEISIRGGEYGPYSLLIQVDGVSIPMEAVVYQSNWWNVVKFDLDISIDRAAGTITFTSSAKVVNAGSRRITEKHTTTASFSDGKPVHYIVTV